MGCHAGTSAMGEEPLDRRGKILGCILGFELSNDIGLVSKSCSNFSSLLVGKVMIDLLPYRSFLGQVRAPSSERPLLKIKRNVVISMDIRSMV